MISLASKARGLEKIAVDNSPFLLTAVGVAGTISTAVLAFRAARSVDSKLAQTLDEHPPHTEFTLKDELKTTWKCYVPPAVSGSLTIGAVVFANRIGTKRAAALAAAFTITEKAYTEYREKVISQIGGNEERKVRDNIVRDHLAANPQSESNVVIIGSGNVLCYEMYTGRYFDSSVEEIKKAINDTNYQINAHGYASISDFYDRLGLPRTSISDETGWSSDKLMDVDFTTNLSEDGRPCVAINFMTGPVRDYQRFH